VRSHGWYDLPPFAYEREKGVLTTFLSSAPLTPTLSPHRGERENAIANPRRGEREDGATEITFQVRAGKLAARGEADAKRLRAIALRVFSLDLDLSDADRSFSHEAALSRALKARGGRMLRAPTLFEDAVKMLFTTNCSWGATRGMVSRLIELAGGGGRAFPSPESVARLRTSTIESRVRCGYRAPALSLFARRVASGRLDLSTWEDRRRPSEEVREAIVSERGFGPYAAEGLLRILGRHDFYALDSWTRQQYRRLYPGPARSTDRAIARRYARFGAHRGLALWLDLTKGWHADSAEWP
jgi:N-glycosylase/DNA lyase